MNFLSIANTSIRSDKAGRYCLNDLHRAAGAEQRHRPKYWLENQQTLELVAEIEKGGIPPIESKQGVGTFVIKELAIAYATWISASFYLRVIRAYEAFTHLQQDWRRQRHITASSNKLQAMMLSEARAAAGKATKPHHYINEAKLINGVMTGAYAGRDRDRMSFAELDLLARLETHNAVLIGHGLAYDDRKARLVQEAARHRSLAFEPAAAGAMRLVQGVA